MADFGEQVSDRLQASDLAAGLLLGDGVEIGADVAIGGNVVIHGGTRIGPRVVIQDGAVIGKPPRLGPLSSAPREASPPAVLGEGAAVLAGAIVLAGAELGPGAIAGDQSQIRERSAIGEASVIGRGSAVDNDVHIGARVRVQTNCYITAYTEVEDDVFVGPGVTTTNDNTMGRHASDVGLAGVHLRRACRIGGGAVLCPGLEVGEEAFVGAGAVVTADVPRRAVMMGVPARQVRAIDDEDLLERWR
jgi:acetyltransferase-like isoleucine patch superfamily enzyme